MLNGWKEKFYAKILYICEVAFAQYMKINDIFAGGLTISSSTGHIDLLTFFFFKQIKRVRILPWGNGVEDSRDTPED